MIEPGPLDCLTLRRLALLRLPGTRECWLSGMLLPRVVLRDRIQPVPARLPHDVRPLCCLLRRPPRLLATAWLAGVRMIEVDLLVGCWNWGGAAAGVKRRNLRRPT